MKKKDAITLLKKYNPKSYKPILKHTQKVAQIAVKIAKQISNKNLEFIQSAAILHDIGRGECPPGRKSHMHGVIGGDILRNYRLEKYARVAERHLGGGIDKKEAKRVGFPPRTYIPKSQEEKIICYADKLVAGDKKIKIENSIDRFMHEIGTESANKIIKLHNYLVEKGMKGLKLKVIRTKK